MQSTLHVTRMGASSSRMLLLVMLLFVIRYAAHSQSCERSPAIVCPPNFYSCNLDALAAGLSGVATATAIDVNCPAPIITFRDDTTSMDICNGGLMIKRIWRASYPDDVAPWNYSECTQNIVIADTEAPDIQNCPLDISIMTGPECQELIDWTPPTASDDCGIASITSNIEPGSMFELGSTVVTYTVTDSCGKVSECSFIVTVNIDGTCCDEVPVVACPADYNGCAGESIHPDNTGMGTIMSVDTSCGETLLTYHDEILSTGPCDGQIEIRRNWILQYTDHEELNDTCTQLIVLKDDTSPEISNCPADTTLPIGLNSFAWDPPVIIENCNYTIQASHESGDTFPLGTTEVVIIATDDCGNSDTCSFNVTVQEEASGSSLTINCPDDLLLECDKDYGYQPIPQPEVLSECMMCEGGNIAGFIYMGEFQGHQYYCSDGKTSWPYAKSIAESKGGHLVIINSQEENDFVASKLQTNAAWIGLSDKSSEGHFKWVDGSGITYSNWYPGQPNNYKGAQDYVEMLKSGEWNDQYNNRALEFVIEISCYSLIQTEGPAHLGEVQSTTTVSFMVEDQCGNVATCSYDIIVESTSLHCPEDIEVTTTADWVTIEYPNPELTTCCPQTSSGHAMHYSDFVYMGHHNGSHYYCSKSHDSWENASKTCKERGGHLAIINDAHENHFLADKLGDQVAYIGYSDHMEEGNWKDVHGKDMTYSNWDSNQPNNYNGSQHYAELHPSGFWNDNYASYHREYIMEMPSYHLRLLEGLPSGSEFPVGTTEIVYESTDACGNVDTCSFNVIVNQEAGSAGYCESYGRSTSYAYIQSARLNHVRFNSGNDWGYKFHSNYCVDQYAGQSLYLYLTPGFRSSSYTAYWKIYIDINDDGDFSDEGEVVGSARSSRSVRGYIPIPSHTASGHIRLRISMSLSDYPDSACDLFNHGEVEDFCLNVSGGVDSKISILKSSIQPVELATVPGDGKELPLSRIYPNPVNQTLFVDADPNSFSGYSVMTTSGQVLKKQEVDNRELDVSNLSPGFYFIQFHGNDGSMTVEKFIVE